MTRTLTSSATIRRAVGTAALVAGVAAMVAPPAAATVTSIALAPTFTIGLHTIGTGCPYTVNVTVDDNTKPVYFFEEGQGPSGFAEAMPVNGVAKATWIPSRTDITYIYAVQPDAWPETRQYVSVGTGINAGSACIAL
ncbi:hypothetical protein ACFWPK_02185 [Nocardia sp. NPDC058519]|uniref:hypothetical protein n=1 Tax=Nocardia sp. NPDC058519 TaxID=3346535 RepID=UPI0036692CC2